MFSGIIERKSKVVEVSRQGGGADVVVNLDLQEDLALGESVAFDGVCLTVIDWNREKNLAKFHLSSETLEKSHFKNVQVGQYLNVERALRLSDRLSGHYVQGHVDGCATLIAVTTIDQTYELKFQLPEALVRYTVTKGSIAIQGVSLTINSLEGNMISIRVIPHTWDVTSLSSLKVGDLVNIEVDVLAKYVERMMGHA